MFDEMTSIDMLVQNIMMFTKTLVNADRCALFLVDEEKRELYADYFDEGLVNRNSGSHLFLKRPQIRFSQDKGIAGYVSNTAEVNNISLQTKTPKCHVLSHISSVNQTLYTNI
jgi:cAMP and cAMP-inhibited cGMP 3',5'-cyclic phosphodiesterase 10